MSDYPLHAQQLFYLRSILKWVGKALGAKLVEKFRFRSMRATWQKWPHISIIGRPHPDVCRNFFPRVSP